MRRGSPGPANDAEEQALLDRIDAELEDVLGVRPSPAFLPGVRRRVAELQARHETAHRWWLAPALALGGLLVAGHLIRDTPRVPASAASPSTRSAAPQPITALEAEDPAPTRIAEVPSSAARQNLAPGPSVAVDRQEPAVAPARLRVFVPAEDERAVRRLARRLRGRAAPVSVLTPETDPAGRAEAPFDFTLEPTEDPQALMAFEDRVPEGVGPSLGEPLSFDLVVEKAGRET